MPSRIKFSCAYRNAIECLNLLFSINLPKSFYQHQNIPSGGVIQLTDDTSKYLYMLKIMAILIIAGFLIYNGATRYSPSDTSSNASVHINVSEKHGDLVTNSIAMLEIVLGAAIVIAVLLWGKFKSKPAEWMEWRI
jgi:hypothetical protein